MILEEFKVYLKEKKLEDQKIKANLKTIIEFNDFLSKQGGSAELAMYDDLHNFSAHLIETKRNHFDNYINLLRFAYFIKSNDLIIATMELIDGSEVMENFSKRLTDEFGKETRDNIFAELEIPPLGLHPQKRPEITKKLIKRFLSIIDKEKCKNFLANGLRDKYTESYKKDRQKFLEAENIDEFLKIKHASFIETLTKHFEETSLFFTQEIDEEVLEYVKNQQGLTEAGVRVGEKVIITKIPYMTKQFINETDRRKKRYYYCHCPWVREALRKEDQPVSPIFCNCSGGYYKNYWEAVLGQPVKVELLESVLKGDDTCKFELRLPQEIIETLE